MTEESKRRDNGDLEGYPRNNIYKKFPAPIGITISFSGG